MKRLSLYLVSQNANDGYDTYSSFVVVGVSKEARPIEVQVGESSASVMTTIGGMGGLINRAT